MRSTAATSTTMTKVDTPNAPRDGGPPCRVRVLGDVTIDGAPVTSRKIRTILVRLAITPGDIVGDDALIECLWPAGPPKSARTALQTHVGALRDLLEPDRARRDEGSYLFHRHGGYVLELGRDLDVTRLREGVDRAESLRSHSPEVAATVLKQVLDLWRPDPLREFADEPWASAAAATLEEYALRALTVRMELLVGTGASGDAIPALEEAIATYPYDERLAALLMTALARAGRQADALAAYQDARRRLVEDLGIEPGPELREAERRVLSEQPAPASASMVDDDESIFVGRVALEEQIRRDLRTRRLVTLTGPGGVGKTRLARRVAAHVANHWGARVHVIDLGTTAGGGVGALIAGQLGAHMHPKSIVSDAIASAIEDRETLLVLDTCEHLAGEVAALVDELLERSTARILTTSRVPLGHRREVVRSVDPLSVDEALRLLLERAGLEEVSDDDRVALGEVCRRLDALPLAVELAAGRLRSLEPRQFANLVRRGRAELRGGDDRPLRHRSLDQMIAWSYDLLDEPAKRALRTLSVIHGSFDVSTLAGLFDEGSMSTELLLHLHERSLLQRDDNGFRMLDTVREFAAAKAGPEMDELRERHAQWILRATFAHATGQTRLADSLAPEIGPALDHFAAKGGREELVLLSTLGLWWVEASRISEGRRRCEAALARHPEAGPELRIIIESWLGFLCWYEGDGRAAKRWLHTALPALRNARVPQAVETAETALAFVEGRSEDALRCAETMLQAIGGRDQRRMVALFMAANVALYADEFTLAVERYRELRDIADEVGNRHQRAAGLRFEGLAMALAGSVDAGWALAERGRAALGDGDLVGRSQADAIRATISLEAGELDLARDLAVESLRLTRASFDSFSLRAAVPVIAAVDAANGNARRAATAIGWIRHILSDSELTLAPHYRRLLDSATTLVAEGLGPSARRVFATAAALDLGELHTELRSRASDPGDASSSGGTPTPT